MSKARNKVLAVGEVLMALKFPYKKEKSPILGTIHRPMAQVFLWSEKGKYWSEVWMIVDTGADYTLNGASPVFRNV